MKARAIVADMPPSSDRSTPHYLASVSSVMAVVMNRGFIRR